MISGYPIGIVINGNTRKAQGDGPYETDTDHHHPVIDSLLLYWIRIDLEFKFGRSATYPNSNRINRNAGWHAYGNIHTAFGITYCHADAYHDLDIHPNHHFCYPNYFNPNLYFHSHHQPLASSNGYPNTHFNAHEYSHIYANTQRHPMTSLVNPVPYLNLITPYTKLVE